MSRDPVTATDHRILFSISSSWPFVHWPCPGGGNQEPGWVTVTRVTGLPCVSPPIYPGHIWDSHSRHDLFWSTRFCISWTPWVHAVHCGPRLNVSWDLYGHRAKVPRLHIVNDNLKGIRNSARENIFSLTKHFTFVTQGERFLPLSHSLRLHVKLICNTAHIWGRLENWELRGERESH